MIFDTGSSWVWFQTVLCQHCMANEHKFDYRNSYTFRQMSNQVSELRYGKGAVWGFDAIDQVCVQPHGKIGDGCMADYHFKAVTRQ